MKKIYQVSLLCLLGLLSVSFSTLQARRNDRRRSFNNTVQSNFHYTEVPSKWLYRFKHVPPKQQIFIVSKYKEGKAFTEGAYLNFLFFGVGHHIYFGEIGLFVLHVIVGFFAIGFIWSLIDLFRMPGLVKEYNENYFRELLENTGN